MSSALKFKVISVITGLGLLNIVHAQDTIYTKTGETIICEISGVDDNIIEYAKWGKGILKTISGVEVDRIGWNKSKTAAFVWNKTSLTEYFTKNGTDGFEGIYEGLGKNAVYAKYILGVKKEQSGYMVIYLAGAGASLWIEGEMKAKLYPTGSQNVFKADWYNLKKVKNADAYIEFISGGMNVIGSDGKKDGYLKIFPTAEQNSGAASGTGFAISADGYIVTNQHVTNGAKNIKVKGINGEFSESYSAKVIIEDQVNDLAIIKIVDKAFNGLGSPPYLLKPGTAKVGNSIFVLGFPYPEKMGEKVKLTNGIISAKTGAKDDVTKYQISAPITHGNSGGPLFDQEGNVIGIVNSGMSRELAENANYAVKVNYLFNLLDAVDETIKLPSQNTLVGKDLSDQVLLIEKFVYIIEVNQ